VTPLVAAIGSALWLGILTSISPCPLATNLAAVSYISRELHSPWRTVISGILYALGRCFAYIVLAWLIVGSLLEVPAVALFLQGAMNRILGPLLILVGIILLGLIRLPGLNANWVGRLGEQVGRNGSWGALLLGGLFALSFCPVSAALYFGSLIPIAMERQSPVILPMAYGIGTGLPVLVLSFALLGGLQTASLFFKRLSSWEKPARIITAAIFIAAGAYYVYVYLLLPGS
jgi:cytochrome c-type biogenesis protein